MRGVTTALLTAAAGAMLALATGQTAHSAIVLSPPPAMLPAPPMELRSASGPGLLPAPALARSADELTSPRSAGGNKLDLSVARPATRGKSSGIRRSAFVSCNPPYGTHPKAAQVCRDLALANGDFGALPGEKTQQMCTMIYSPVTVTARGRWNNQTVRYEHTYSNDCDLRTKTGPVFAF